MGRLKLDADPSERSALDAWDAAHPDVAADVAHQMEALLAGVAVGKLVDPALGGQAPDAFLAHWYAQREQAEPDAGAAPYRRDEARSVGQSCAAQGAAVQPKPEGSPGAAELPRGVSVLQEPRKL